MTTIVIQDATKEWRTEKGEIVRALDRVSLMISDNEILLVVGPSGCGKTTLLSLIAGLENPTSGTVEVDGVEVNGPNRNRGVVFQADTLFMWRTVRRNVEYGLEVQGLARAERTARADLYLELVGLSRFADLYPKELSGGMKKRCQIAAVLANDPAVLLMDEPFGALDYPTKLRLQEELLAILGRTPKTTCFVSHDIEEALFLGDRIAVMANGVIRHLIPVPFSRPRENELRLTPEFVALKADLWKLMDELQHDTEEMPT